MLELQVQASYRLRRWTVTLILLTLYFTTGKNLTGKIHSGIYKTEGHLVNNMMEGGEGLIVNDGFVYQSLEDGSWIRYGKDVKP